MGIQKGEIIFSQSSWSEEAAAKIAPLIEPVVLGKFKKDVENNRAVLWRVSSGDWVTWLVTRIEKYECGHIELVLEVIAGTNSRLIVSELKNRVKKMGVNSIRFETFHPEKTAARLVGCLGFTRAATVFRVDL